MAWYEVMASSCTRGGIGSVLEDIYSLKGWLGIGTSYEGGDGVTIPGSIQKMCGCGTWEHGLVVTWL